MLSLVHRRMYSLYTKLSAYFISCHFFFENMNMSFYIITQYSPFIVSGLSQQSTKIEKLKKHSLQLWGTPCLNPMILVQKETSRPCLWHKIGASTIMIFIEGVRSLACRPKSAQTKMQPGIYEGHAHWNQYLPGRWTLPYFCMSQG